MTTRPSVWAPFPDRVDLAIDADRHPMTRDDGGWWTAEVDLEPGADYGFSLDGSAPLPDPRSPYQPYGVNGLSRTVDHAAFDWTDDGFGACPLADAVIYELHVGAFTPAGTFDAAIDRLSDLADLGITHLELMPVAEFSGDRGWGYDGVDPFAPHHAYGGPDGLKRLVDAAHGHGLAVLLDVVYNHLGPEGNHLPRYGPFFTAKYATPWGDAVNFDDAGSHEVRRFVVDNALAWMRDYHLDGLRLDAVHTIYDQSAVHILEELALVTRALETEVGRPLVLIAESDLNDPRLVRPIAEGGYGLDAVWADDVHHALHVALTGEQIGYYADFADADALARAIVDPFMYAGHYSTVRDRLHGRPPGNLPGERFVAALQNHDQVGNRALGERLSHLVPPGRVRIGAALLLTLPYVPLLFAGAEWAASSPFRYFTGHASPELAGAVLRGRREEFGHFGWDPEQVPDPQAHATFLASKLDWSERDHAPHADVLAWYRELLRIRAATPALRDGDRGAVVVRHDAAAGWIVVERGPISVAANLGTEPADVPLSGVVRLAWPHSPERNAESLRLVPDGVVVVARDA
ncbi:MAG: malto-oligosyltrehalose trehalohydrolase [Chloroflexota bacterium]|nr:malto-oligosyltrehalose trehalohydrolase [Chloroflexota bacterium]